MGRDQEPGKAKSFLNAVKSGLTGRTVLLSGDDAALYQAHISRLIEHYAPVGGGERRALDLDPQLTCISARKLADAA